MTWSAEEIERYSQEGFRKRQEALRHELDEWKRDQLAKMERRAARDEKYGDLHVAFGALLLGGSALAFGFSVKPFVLWKALLFALGAAALGGAHTASTNENVARMRRREIERLRGELERSGGV